MNPYGRAWLQFCRRHAEAFFIIAFLLADSFLSGWALTLGTVAAILYVFTPAILTLLTLTPAGRITFIKAFAKTAKVQRLGLLLFWIYSIRLLLFAAAESRLYTLADAEMGGNGTLPSISNALILGAQQWGPLAYLACPIIIYFGACLLAIILRSRLKATKTDPDLIRQRQKWSGAIHLLFLSAFIAGILSITLSRYGPAYMISNWLIASCRDANFFCGSSEPMGSRWEEAFFPTALPDENSNSTAANQDATTNSTSAQDAAPSSTQDAAPSSTQDAAPSSTQDAAPSSTQDAAPGSTQDAAPSSAQDAAPSSTPDASPGSAQDTAPGSTQDAASSSGQDAAQSYTSAQESDPSANSPQGVASSPSAANSEETTVVPCCPMLQGVMPNCPNLFFIGPFDRFIQSSTSIALFVLLLQPALKLNALLTSFCWRVVSPRSMQNVIEGLLEALHLPSRTLNFREAHPFWTNAARTFVWLMACFAALFWLFGFCGGPLGHGIHNWMMASVVDAGFANAEQAPDWLFDPKLRIFLGSLVALYGTAPIAVTAAVILPYAKPRKFSLNADGLSFPQGPYLSLWGRQFRLWSDLKSMTVQKSSRLKPPLEAKFTLTFRSGGHVSFNTSQIAAQDLKVLMDCIDQHAVACSVSSEVISICRMLENANRDKIEAASDGITDTAIASIPAQEFKSTIFIPLAPAESIPGTQTRIIKQLSSKPLCAVYLGRTEDGRMVTVKQFYLAQDTDETLALAKILRREYELLTRLDHPGIAKILDSFTVAKSTFLIIEHRVGVDLRAAIQEHGPRSEGLTIAWGKQLCEIMIYLHACEPAVLHRDLTPDNVIAGEDGQLRLIDFGAAREFLEGITGTMIGKHCYVAPEQLRGCANQRSDIYSFGATLYFLLTGRDPIALSQSSPAMNIDCSSQLDQLISDCTEFDEQKRPQSFVEVLNRLHNLNIGISLKLRSSKKEEAFV